MYTRIKQLHYIAQKLVKDQNSHVQLLFWMLLFEWIAYEFLLYFVNIFLYNNFLNVIFFVKSQYVLINIRT